MKLTKIIGFYLIVNTILLIGISSCTKNSETLQAEIPLSDSTCMANVTYSQNIKPIINTTCAISGCHVSNGFKDFSTYTALKDELDTKGTAYFLSRIKSGGVCLLLILQVLKVFQIVIIIKLRHGLIKITLIINTKSKITIVS